MGFKEYMDTHGKYITQAKANARVAAMQATRQELLDRLDYEQRQAAAQRAKLHRASDANASTIAKPSESMPITVEDSVDNEQSPSSSSSTQEEKYVDESIGSGDCSDVASTRMQQIK